MDIVTAILVWMDVWDQLLVNGLLRYAVLAVGVAKRRYFWILRQAKSS